MSKIKKILLVIMAVSFLTGCNLGTLKMWKNGNIDSKKKEQIKALNDKLFAAITSNDVTSIRNLMSDKLLEKADGNLEQLIFQISASFQSDNYKILDEYNVHNSKANMNTTLPSGLSNDNDYRLKYVALNKETYVSLLLPTGLDNDLLITVIYGNYNNQWKINILQFGQYSLFGKNATQYYKLAKENYEKSHLIDAVNYIGLSQQCLKPAELFQYQIEKDINEFYEKVMKEINSKFTFPLTLDNINSKPKVFRIYPEMIDEGIYPMVFYLSEINLKDTVSLRIENEKVKMEVGKLFSGIDKDKKYVFYSVFNEFPNDNKIVERYGFIDKLTE
jgi:hypothetical protein